MNDSSSRHILLVVGLAMSGLLLLSAVPWSRLTGNLIKDFNLFGQLFPSDIGEGLFVEDVKTGLDSELDEFLAEYSVPESADTTVAEAVDVVGEADSAVVSVPLSEAPLVNGVVGIECYLPEGTVAFPHLRSALNSASGRTVRIAVLGDSFIEGDLFSQDLRDAFQSRYGGVGVGFVQMHSDFPGFRRSVKMSDSGWTLHDIRTMGYSDTVRTLSCDYAVASGNAVTTFSGNAKNERLAAWDRSTFVFLSRDSGTVVMSGDFGERQFMVGPSSEPQFLTVEGRTARLKVSTAMAGLIALGTYLDGQSGVQVDCMSIRGNSGMPLRRINAGLCASMAECVPYDMIILEYGINAISEGQSDYSAYGLAMSAVIERLRSVYPCADILVLGVSDRGVKRDGVVKSLPACASMVDVQRRMAHRSGVHFWDMRAAMGGENSAVDWRRRKLLNADYIHLNQAGGSEMARLLFDAISQSLDD
ncbi:MAG: hypothetical protein K2J38_02315 [Muribaculaceae bacterium]|nr:hypothetical protein [Muribaculaceae bacterium]